MSLKLADWICRTSLGARKNKLFHKRSAESPVFFCAIHVQYHNSAVKKLMEFRVAVAKTQVVFQRSAFLLLRRQRWIQHHRSPLDLKWSKGPAANFWMAKRRKSHGVCGAVYQDTEKFKDGFLRIILHHGQTKPELLTVSKFGLASTSLIWHHERLRSGRTAPTISHPIFCSDVRWLLIVYVETACYFIGTS